MKTPAPFGTLAALSGYDVIDNATGRVMAHRDSHKSANGTAYHFNQAAKGGPQALARVLGGKQGHL